MPLGCGRQHRGFAEHFHPRETSIALLRYGAERPLRAAPPWGVHLLLRRPHSIAGTGAGTGCRVTPHRVAEWPARFRRPHPDAALWEQQVRAIRSLAIGVTAGIWDHVLHAGSTIGDSRNTASVPHYCVFAQPISRRAIPT